jgi:hypothetical protein
MFEDLMFCSGVQAAIRYTLNINAQNNMSLLGKQELCGTFPWQRGASTVGMQQRCNVFSFHMNLLYFLCHDPSTGLSNLAAQ